jgi:hypothetical protein
MVNHSLPPPAKLGRRLRLSREIVQLVRIGAQFE